MADGPEGPSYGIRTGETNALSGRKLWRVPLRTRMLEPCTFVAGNPARFAASGGPSVTGGTMATSVKCPTCGATFLAGRANAAGSLTCPECDTSFKTRGTLPSGAAEKSKKPRSTAREERGSAARMSPLVLAGIGGGVLLLLVVLGFVFLRGKGDGGKPADGQQAAQPAFPFDAAKFAVVEAPLPESELPDPEPQPAPAVTTASPADAAGNSQKKALANATESSAADSSKPLWDLP